ncbi:hypothetical protein BGZ65_010885 [Modicella reniformis]|uniref:F-box domain-containing protein n=1 Tax=Modicella reniformis TaxID=1440133 RepID=A0A9P6J4C2_9FUNG|nr:hypothetical protein BGZ65_010885 [Modicella reniformis]
MPSEHPLEIPEIVSYMASYMRKRDHTACALVSKTWYQVFNPFIWHHISWNYERPFLPEAIHRHTQLVRTVKTVYAYKKETAKLLKLRLPNLVSLNVVYNFEQDMKEWIIKHPSMTRLTLRGAWSLDSKLWNSLLGFRHLKDFTMSYREIGESVIDTFWQLCTHLERLEIVESCIPQQGNLLSMTFPSIKQLELDRMEDVSVLEFMQRCPNLTSFKYSHSQERARFVSSFSELVSARIWPHLHSVSIGWREVAEDSVLRIIGGMQRINDFKISGSLYSFRSTAMELLRPHFSNIRVLHLRRFKEWQISRLAQEILTSCPLLEQLTAPPINACVVAEGKPWVCMRLRELELIFVYMDSTLHHLQPLVFNQLARLVQLEKWYQTDYGGDRCNRRLDLTLVNGLGKLSTLRSLRSIGFHHSSQVMGQHEIDWIFEHWTNLENIGGNLNMLDGAINEGLKEQLKERGITFRPSYWWRSKYCHE